MNEKYLGTSKKKVAVVSIVGSVVLLLIVGPNSATPSPVPEMEEPEVALETVVVEPVVEETTVVVEETTLEMPLLAGKVIPEFNISGHLLVPYERFMDFGSAFGYAHDVLGDASTNNETKQYFVWRGGFYHTETLIDTVEDTVEVEVDSVEAPVEVKDDSTHTNHMMTDHPEVTVSVNGYLVVPDSVDNIVNAFVYAAERVGRNTYFEWRDSTYTTKSFYDNAKKMNRRQ